MSTSVYYNAGMRSEPGTSPPADSAAPARPRLTAKPGQAGGSPRHRPRDAAATRADLLRAARQRFAKDGYDRVSVRDIAADAGANIALISRYFGSKEGLFVEALSGAGRFPDLRAASPSELPTKLLVRILDQPDDYGGENPIAALLRSSGHEGVAERMRVQIDEDLTRRLAELSPEADAPVRADLFVALMLGIGVLHTVIRKPPLADQRFEQLQPYVRRMFGVLFPEARGDQQPEDGTGR
jgi:AcrR family transcriptional regulator